MTQTQLDMVRNGLTLKSIPIVAAEDSGSNSSSQYLVSTVRRVSRVMFLYGI